MKHTRRQVLAGGTVAAVAAFARSGGRHAAATTVPPGDAEFPRRLEHKFGTTEIPSVPSRVVCVGLSDQDAVLALGVAPVAVTEWFGEQPYAAWPWALDALGDATPEVLNGTEIDFERIAALQPDVILSCYGGLAADDYELLSAIAPTVAQSGEYDDWSAPWQDITRQIGQALGRDAAADKLIADVEAAFDEAKAEHPEFADAGGIVVDGPYSRGYGVFDPDDPRGRVMGTLGFAYPDAIDALVPDDLFYAEFSAEQIDLLDQDVVVWLSYGAGERESMEGDPLYQQLDIAAEGRTVFLDEVDTAAMGFSTVLSLPYLLDRLVARLASAVDGDPETPA